MAERRASLMDPRIEQLMAKVDSKFTLVTLSSMRAREINDYYNQLGEGLGRIVPPQVTSVSRKPLSIAMEEVAAGKIKFERIEVGEDDEAAEELAAAEDSFRQMDSLGHRAAAWLAQGDLAARRGRIGDAAAVYRRAAEALQDVRF